MRQRRTSDQRFWSRVKRTSSCWLWLGAPGKDGHGRHFVSRGQLIRPARYVFQATYGPMDSSEIVRTLCGNPLCVRPTHLQATDRAGAVAQRGSKFPIIHQPAPLTWWVLPSPVEEARAVQLFDGSLRCDCAAGTYDERLCQHVHQVLVAQSRAALQIKTALPVIVEGRP